MDDKELDEFLKNKLNGKIKSSDEFKNKMENVIKIQQEKMKNQGNEEKDHVKNDKKGSKNNFRKILSIAAMFVVVFTLGVVLYDKQFQDGNSSDDMIVTIKAIEPTKLNSGVVEEDSEFIIYTEEETTAESVRKSVYVEPALDYTIEKINNKEFKLNFKQNIPDNTIVKLQYVKNQITENSWAYQSSKDLSVINTFPNGNDASVESVIEIELSYAAVENFEENVSISPKIDGNWEHLGKVWRFTPSSRLEKNQVYKVFINSGIKSEDEELKQDYVFEFGTYEQGGYCEYEVVTVDKISNYKSNDAVKLYYISNDVTIKNVEISRFDNCDKFIEYLKSGNKENASSLGNYDFDIVEREYDKYIILKNNLSNGYYVASVKNESGNELFNCPIQINDLSAYVMESERDVITWVASNNDLANNISVSYKNNNEKTNNQGYVLLKNVADNSDTIDYMKIGNDENKLVVGVYSYSTDNYPSSYVYTDRPLYKNTDTINIWGFVPVSQFYDKVEDEFYIQLGEGEKNKVTVDENGSINYQFKLQNSIDEETDIKLYYKETVIARRYIEIKNYELQNYTYDVSMDSNCVYNGDTLNIDVTVNHITNMVVPNKNVILSFNGKDYKQKTGEDGIAHFSVKVNIEDSKTTAIDYKEIRIYNGDLEEYNTAETTIGVNVLTRDVDTSVEEGNIYKFTLYKLMKNQNMNIQEETYNLNEIHDGTYDTSVKIELEEIVYTRYISGYEYNEYTKQNETKYSYDRQENIETLRTLSTNNGSFEIAKDEIPMKKDTDDKSYSYSLRIVYKDREGREVEDSVFINDWFDGEYTLFDDGIYYDESNYSDFSSDLLPNVINSYSYSVYKYMLKTDKSEFSIGDTVQFSLNDCSGNKVTSIENEGTILRIVFKESINTVDFIENNEYKYTFTENDFPGCKMTSAYFKDGKFYRMPVYYFDFNEEERKVDIEITSDKEKYSPGDEVTLNVKTTNNGTPVKSSVNLSVANEAVFETAGGDETNILKNIYAAKNYPVYTFSTYLYNSGNIFEGGGAEGENIRKNFGDTAYFETVETNSQGVATVKFTLPDNVTTYRVTAHSANKDLYVGVDTISLTSTLDFFVQSQAPRNLKKTDDVVLTATSILENKADDVKYQFYIKEVDKQIEKISTANSMVSANFGKLDCGIYHAVITGYKGNDQDSIEYEFSVNETAQQVVKKETMTITNDTVITPTKNPIILEFYNKNMKQYVDYIDFIEDTVTSRLDTIIASNVIQKYKSDYYKTDIINNNINITDYEAENGLKNLKNGNADIVLTSLINYYGMTGYKYDELKLTDNMNLFEYYLYCAANNESVLLDLQYLKDEKDIDNYGKLLLTLSFEFLGDYSDAEELYKNISLSNDEKQEYASIIAIIDTFIDKDKVTDEINDLIENNPSDEYLRFAILSYFVNNSKDVEKQETVKIISGDASKEIVVNSNNVEKLTIYGLSNNSIKFETSSDDLMVSYYYQTTISEVNDKVDKNIKINLKGDLKKNSEVTLNVNFENSDEGVVRIALPNSLRLALNYDNSNSKYYYMNNNIDYITLYKEKGCSKMEIPLIVVSSGQYVFENIVYSNNGIYNISNSLELDIVE